MSSTNAKGGIAHQELGDDSNNFTPLFELIIDAISGPKIDDKLNTQFLITNNLEARNLKYLKFMEFNRDLILPYHIRPIPQNLKWQ